MAKIIVGRIGQCNFCQKPIFTGLASVKLDVEIDGEDGVPVKRTYTFCSEKCMDDRLSNLNNHTVPFQPKVFVEQKVVVSRNPLRVKVNLGVMPIEIKVLS